MARNLTTAQRNLIRSGNVTSRVLTTWYLDGGTYWFCSDPYDQTDGTDTWIGASALFGATEVKSSGTSMAAESVTISVDGSRVRASGFADPADLFRDILELGLANRRVDFSLGLKGPTDQDIVLVMPMFSGKINSPKLLYPQHAVGAVQSPGQHNDATLEFILDSLAIRYQWTSGRTRSNEDQLEVDPTDKFYAYVGDNLTRESTLYWGKTGPMTQAQNQAWLQGVVDQFF